MSTECVELSLTFFTSNHNPAIVTLKFIYILCQLYQQRDWWMYSTKCTNVVATPSYYPSLSTLFSTRLYHWWLWRARPLILKLENVRHLAVYQIFMLHQTSALWPCNSLQRSINSFESKKNSLKIESYSIVYVQHIYLICGRVFRIFILDNSKPNPRKNLKKFVNSHVQGVLPKSNWR